MCFNKGKTVFFNKGYNLPLRLIDYHFVAHFAFGHSFNVAEAVILHTPEATHSLSSVKRFCFFFFSFQMKTLNECSNNTARCLYPFNSPHSRNHFCLNLRRHNIAVSILCFKNVTHSLCSIVNVTLIICPVPEDVLHTFCNIAFLCCGFMSLDTVINKFVILTSHCPYSTELICKT